VAIALIDCHMPEMDGYALATEIKQRPGLDRTSLVMLTPTGETADFVRRRSIGLAACFAKPVKRSDLQNAVALALPSVSPSAEPLKPSFLVAEEPIPETVKSLRILLAEDNLVNQRLAVRLLEKKGHRVTVVNHGKEALTAIENASYDLALMDIQMPEMSGFEVTQRVRELERVAGGHLMIIAMTAYAMAGDREKCLEAGMDGYLSKPIHSTELYRVVAELAASIPDSSPSTDHPSASFDQNPTLLERA
jgi:two-component system, sensor histidine kinase and response regulator